MYDSFDNIKIKITFIAESVFGGEEFKSIIDEFKEKKWGICNESKWKANDEALRNNELIVAVYKIKEHHVFIIGIYREVEGWIGILMLGIEYIFEGENYLETLRQFTDDVDA